MASLHISRDDKLILRYVGSATPTDIEAYLAIRAYDAKPDDRLGFLRIPTVKSNALTADRQIYEIESSAPADFPGEVVGGGIVGDPDALDRGQFYAMLALERFAGRREILAANYFYNPKGVGLGEIVESGPGGGSGYLHWLAVAADLAPADITQVLAASNTVRRIYGFVWYYNCAAVAATRTMQAFLGKRAPARPTGFDDTLAANDSLVEWASSAVSLTTGEEGQIYTVNQDSRDGYTIMNDNGAITSHSTATNPNPFPLLVPESDDAEILFDVGSPDAGDKHSIYLLQEEWLVI